MGKLITLEKSVIPACDVADLDKLYDLVAATKDVPGIGGYKIGLELAIPYGLAAIVKSIRYQHTQLPIIYDHQKGGTDIPELGTKFAKAVKGSGVDAVILFPFGGAATEEAWIKACQDAGLTVLVGGHMTQAKFLDNEGGFISFNAPELIYKIAAKNGLTDFVVPGNKTDFVLQYRQVLNEVLGEGKFTLYAPGFISQGGDITETGKVAGGNWHAIVGGAIYNNEGVDAMHQAAIKVTSQIVGVVP
ncbi:MAG: orotidine 5'-phosphate decarboxylase / HUMPS family protein [Candidatus Nealsonbacteria bacterium]